MNPRISLSVLLAALLDLAAGGAFAATTAAQTATPAPAARLTILVDNSVARTGVKAVWGFACLVEAAIHVFRDVFGDRYVARASAKPSSSHSARRNPKAPGEFTVQLSVRMCRPHHRDPWRRSRK